MKTKIYIISILFCVLICACKSEHTKITPIILTSQLLGSYENDSVFVSYPNKFILKDSLLFMHANSSGHFINIYSYPELEFITYVGVEGKSDEELLSISCFDVDDDYIYLIDISTKKLLKYSIKEILEHNEKPAEIVYLSDINTPALSYTKTEFGFISIATTGDMFLQIDESGKKIKGFGSLPTDGTDAPKIEPIYIPSLWGTVIDYDKTSGLTAVAAKLGDVLEVYNHKTDELNLTIGGDGLPDVVNNGKHTIFGKILGYYDLIIANSKVYALYSGANVEDVVKRVREGEKSPNGAIRIKVFSLEGEQIGEYVLDRHITSFDIDTVQNKIIGIDYDNASFCSFDLK